MVVYLQISPTDNSAVQVVTDMISEHLLFINARLY